MEKKDKMMYNKLGKTGLLVSQFAYGTWVNYTKETDDGGKKLYNLMKIAYTHGVNTFDTAEAYGDGVAEKMLGQALKLGYKDKLWEREDLVIITKIFFGGQGLHNDYAKTVNKQGLSRKHIVEGLKLSLKRMDLDHVDVALAHRPDPVASIEEVVWAFNLCISMGLAFYWGTSEWNAQQIQEAHLAAEKFGLIPPCVDQTEYSVLHRKKVEKEFKPLYEQGLGLTTWSPLASGLLTGKYKGKQIPKDSRLAEKFVPQQDNKKLMDLVDKAELVRPVAEKLGCSMSQVSLAWILKNQRVSTVILGASSEEQLLENLGALDVLPKLTPDIMATLNNITKGGNYYTQKVSLAFRTEKVNRASKL